MSKLLFLENINVRQQSCIVDVEKQEIICVCSKAKSELIFKAFKDSEQYSLLADKISAFYNPENGEESKGDLGDIGELTAIHFGFL